MPDDSGQADIPPAALELGSAVYLAWLNDAGNCSLISENGSEGDYPPSESAQYDAEDRNQEGWYKPNDIDAPASIGAKGSATVRHIRLDRDIYYTRGSHGEYLYYVQPGHYMCMGDNSAQSSDSRTWGAVPERLMLGKAVFVFWPAWPENRIGFIK